MKTYLRMILTATFLTLCSLTRAQSPSTVLVVANANNPNSVALANYYVSVRQIPAQNELLLNLPAKYTADTVDTIDHKDYKNLVAAPIYAWIATLPHIDYIVLCRNLPSIVEPDDCSVDSALAGSSLTRIANPYFGAGTAFNSTTYGMYLVTRLDGWFWGDAYALVDDAIWAYPSGLFFLDPRDSRDNDTVDRQINQNMAKAAIDLQAQDIAVMLTRNMAFSAPATELGGYYSWGSNDPTFTQKVWEQLEFMPGAIGETAVNTSAKHLRSPGGAQSQIAQLIHQGITGVKGYVSDPGLTSVADPVLLFLHYTSGMNLAESFYGASAYLGWKDVVVGDPLCNPYGQ